MEATSRPGQTPNPGDASDEDLIRRFSKSPPDMGAGNELAERCMPKLRKSIVQVVFAKSSMCPAGHDRNAFADDALSRASEYFLRGLPTFQFRGSFEGWLSKLALHAAVDERRKLSGRWKEAPPIVDSLEEVQATGRELPADHPWFRSKYTAHPEELVRDREHRELVTALLILHAQSSNRGADSAAAIRLRAWHDLPVAEIAHRRGSTDRDVFRLFAHDYAELNSLLVEHFRVTALREV